MKSLSTLSRPSGRFAAQSAWLPLDSVRISLTSSLHTLLTRVMQLLENHHDDHMRQDTGWHSLRVAWRPASGPAANNTSRQPYLRLLSLVNANWSGPSFWCHGSTASRGVAVLSRAGAHITDVSIRHQSADGRILSADSLFARGAFTVASIYAPCTAAGRATFSFQHLLPSLPAQRQPLLGGDFNCIAGKLDILDPAGAAGARIFLGGRGGRGKKLTCPSMPIISAVRKIDKANHRRVSGPQHIL